MEQAATVRGDIRVVVVVFSTCPAHGTLNIYGINIEHTQTETDTVTDGVTVCGIVHTETDTVTDGVTVCCIVRCTMYIVKFILYIVI